MSATCCCSSGRLSLGVGTSIAISLGLASLKPPLRFDAHLALLLVTSLLWWIEGCILAGVRWLPEFAWILSRSAVYHNEVRRAGVHSNWRLKQSRERIRRHCFASKSHQSGQIASMGSLRPRSISIERRNRLLAYYDSSGVSIGIDGHFGKARGCPHKSRRPFAPAVVDLGN